MVIMMDKTKHSLEMVREAIIRASREEAFNVFIAARNPEDEGADLALHEAYYIVNSAFEYEEKFMPLMDSPDIAFLAGDRGIGDFFAFNTDPTRYDREDFEKAVAGFEENRWEELDDATTEYFEYKAMGITFIRA